MSIDIAIVEILFSILTLVVAFATLIVALRLTKFFKGGAFMNVWRTLYFVPLFMGLAEVGEFLKVTMLWAVAHLAACLAFLYSLYLFHRTWTKMAK